MRAYFLRRLEFSRTPKTRTHVRGYKQIFQQPKLFVGHRKLAKHPGRHVVVCPRGFSCRIVETQLDDFSSKPDLGAIFVALLMPADAFETTSRVCTRLYLRRFGCASLFAGPRS